MITRITSCKMYKNSKHKSRITAAIDNPLNKELVMQLREYLDEPELASPKPKTKPQDIQPNDDDFEPIDDNPKSSGRSTGPRHYSSPSGTDAFSEAMPEDEFPLEDELSESGPADIVDEEEPVEEAAKLDACEVIQAALRTDSHDVRRVVQNGDELWIHYDDSVNLNNIMESTITAMSKLYPDKFQFNRLARTQNAVVFSK